MNGKTILYYGLRLISVAFLVASLIFMITFEGFTDRQWVSGDAYNYIIGGLQIISFLLISIIFLLILLKSPKG